MVFFFNGCFILFCLFPVCVLYTQGMGNREWREVSTTTHGDQSTILYTAVINGMAAVYKKACFYVDGDVHCIQRGFEYSERPGVLVFLMGALTHDYRVIRCVLCWNKYSCM